MASRHIELPELMLMLAAACSLAGVLFAFHDSILLAGVLVAVSLLVRRRDWKAWLVAASLLAGGLMWSYSDAQACSLWWRTGIVLKAASRQLPYISLRDGLRSATQACSHADQPFGVGVATPVATETLAMRQCDLFQTPLGSFWVPAPGGRLVRSLGWELLDQRVYANGQAVVQPGDVVVDCGAHVGFFTRYALRLGAKRVVAIEPDPVNLACLKRNLAEEIQSDAVNVVEGGVWDARGRLVLHENVERNSAGMTFLGSGEGRRKVEGIPVFPLDEIVEQLQLTRVDFIKMDIEGSERRALAGARETIQRFHPTMAVCSYHLHDDPEVIPRLVKGIDPSYTISAKDVESIDRWIRPKVLFFHVPGT